MSSLHEDVTQPREPELDAERAVMPEVSVVIPTLDRPEFVAQAVTDALRQERVALEVIVVDDGSTDPAATAGLAELDPRIRVIHHPERRGVAAARNTGIEHARGEWVAFLDDDDRWEPEKLRIQLDAAADAGASWAYAGATVIDADERIIKRDGPGEPDALRQRIANPVPGGCSNTVARVDLVQAVGGFDPQLSLTADWDLWIRLADREEPAVCHDFVVGYRRHADNMHLYDLDRFDAELEYIARKYELATVRQPDILAWMGNAWRRRGRRGRAASLYFESFRMRRDPADLVKVVASLMGERAISLAVRTGTRLRGIRRNWTE
jgi:glycosyltransferase involved in cell wall biosynthesis